MEKQTETSTANKKVIFIKAILIGLIGMVVGVAFMLTAKFVNHVMYAMV